MRMILGLSLLGLSLTCFSATVKYQSVASIAETARAFTLANLSPTDQANASIEAKLDNRLRLKQCDIPLQAFFPEYGRQIGNATIGIRCNGEQSWSIYVPVVVKIYRDVVVAAHLLRPGQILSASDLTIEKRNISAFNRDFYSDAKVLVGKQVRHQLPFGRVLNSQNVKSPKAIKRGNLVTLVARKQTFEVRMEGEAMSDGSIGERIRVRNLRSKRIIEGIVKSGNVIEIP